MAYTPNPDREVKDGKAMVSAKELADFKSQYGEDKTLRDLLNADKGLRRKGEDSAPMKSSNSARPASTETRETPAPRESAIAASNDQTSPAPSTSSTPKKEFYRSASGKMVEKESTPAPDEDSGFLVKRMRSALGSSYKKGGSVSSRADGIAQRGKTRGKMC